MGLPLGSCGQESEHALVWVWVHRWVPRWVPADAGFHILLCVPGRHAGSDGVSVGALLWEHAFLPTEERSFIAQPPPLPCRSTRQKQKSFGWKNRFQSCAASTTPHGPSMHLPLSAASLMHWPKPRDEQAETKYVFVNTDTTW